MPGPGGGGHSGGGFGGGGSRGGGFGGGGFGGGPHHRPPHHHHHGWHFGGPRFYFGPRYYGGGGCLGGLIGMLMIPLVFILLASIIFISNVRDAVTAFREGGVVVYDEDTFYSYSMERYAEEFSACDSRSYEDNILVVLLVDDDCQTYRFYGLVGYHIDSKVDSMFGDEYTALGRTLDFYMSEDYRHTLSRALSNTVNKLESDITALNLSSNHTCSDTHTQVNSHLTNLSELVIDSELVNDALTRFTASTDIPIVIVVDEMEDVFGKTMPFELVLTLLVAAAFIGVGIYLIVRVVKNNKKKGDGDGGNRYAKDDGNGGGYSGYTNDRNGNFR